MMKDTYRVPKKYLNLKYADMLFWDAVYFLMETKGVTNHLSATRTERYIEVTHDKLIDLTGLALRTVRGRVSANTLAQTDDPQYNLRFEPDSVKKSYFLILSNYETLVTTKAVQKPTDLFNQSWLKYLSHYPNTVKPTRLPIAFLNRFLMMPPEKTLAFGELQTRIKLPTTIKPPDSAHVHQALSFLKDMGLIQQVGDYHYQLNRAQLNRPAQPLYDALCAKTTPSPIEIPAFAQAKSIDPKRAEQAIALATLGNFNLTVHFEEIFRDLQYVSNDHQMQLLEKKVKIHRKKPPGDKRWHCCWKQFQRDVSNKSYRVKSQKIALTFKTELEQNVTLQLPAINPKSIVWAKIVFWLNIPDYPNFTLISPIHAKLFLGDTQLWEKQITEKDEIFRYDLTRAFRNITAHICDLKLVVASPIPRVSLKSQLETRIWKPDEEASK